MARITLKPGSKVRYSNIEYEIVAPISTSEVILRSLVDNSQLTAPVDELRPLLNQGKPTRKPVQSGFLSR